LLHLLIEQHAKKERERVRVEECVGVGIASDGEIALHRQGILRRRSIG